MSDQAEAISDAIAEVRARVDCETCARGESCERHRPTVCICDTPTESRDGQCGACYRPYRVRNSELPMAEVREAWRKFLADEGVLELVTGGQL